MTHDYDILIAGAGPAGCAAAYDLAKAGKRVLLLDRRSFPRPKACACGLTRKTLKALRYSVEPVIERVCHEIVLQQATSEPKHNEVRVKTRNPICAMAVRERFDAFCLEQTLAAGAHFRKIETILAIRELPTHIELDINTVNSTETLTAPVLIGADGSNGQTRRLSQELINRTPSSRPESAFFAGAEERPALKGTGFSPSVTTAKEGALAPEGISPEPLWYTRGFALEATVPYTALPAELPAGDAPHDLIFDFAPLPGGYGWLFPKGGHINIGVGVFAPTPATTLGAPCLDSETWVSTDLKVVTRKLLTQYSLHKLGIAELPHITGQHLGMGGHAYTPRGRVLLVGDAAGLVDPLTGEGIHSAIVSGQAAAAAILKVMPSLKRPGSTVKGTGFSPSVDAAKKNGAGSPGLQPRVSPEGDLAAAYARELRPLQQTLTFSARAARAFYATPERGFKAMRVPLMRSLVLKTYADGLPYTKLLTGLAKLVT